MAVVILSKWYNYDIKILVAVTQEWTKYTGKNRLSTWGKDAKNFVICLVYKYVNHYVHLCNTCITIPPPPSQDPILTPGLVTDHPTDRQVRVLQQLSELRKVGLPLPPAHPQLRKTPYIYLQWSFYGGLLF